MNMVFDEEPQTAVQSAPAANGCRSYKVVVYRESVLGSMLLGASKVDPVRFGEFLNMNAREGWRVVTMEKDQRRMMGFWKRESYLVIMERAA